MVQVSYVIRHTFVWISGVWVKQRIHSPLTPTYFPFLFHLTKPSPPAGNMLNGMLRKMHMLFYPDPEFLWIPILLKLRLFSPIKVCIRLAQIHQKQFHLNGERIFFFFLKFNLNRPTASAELLEHSIFWIELWGFKGSNLLPILKNFYSGNEYCHKVS